MDEVKIMEKNGGKKALFIRFIQEVLKTAMEMELETSMELQKN